MPVSALLASRPYRPRPLRFIRLQSLGGWRLKVYGIAADLGVAARPELVEATLNLAAADLPQPAIADERYGVGFVIAHDARTASIGLIYWWESGNELHQRCHAGPLATPRAMTRLKHPAAGCVWEIGIIDFERRAWLADVLANPAGPDIDLYISRQLNADV
jgi:hypothetical protein